MEHLAFVRNSPDGMADVTGAIGSGVAGDEGAVERFAV